MRPTIWLTASFLSIRIKWISCKIAWMMPRRDSSKCCRRSSRQRNSGGRSEFHFQEAIFKCVHFNRQFLDSREIETKLESEAQQEWKDQRKRGAGWVSHEYSWFPRYVFVVYACSAFFRLASSMFSQVLLEQRHKMAMKQLEHDMHLEMQKQRELLNQELEIELKHELEVNVL